MARRRKRDPERERFWRRTIGVWERSGKTIRSFCEAAGVSEWSFYAWRRELRRRSGEGEAKAPKNARRRRVTRTGRKASSWGPTFLPLTVTASAGPPRGVIELEHRGTVIRVSDEIESEALTRVLQAIGQAAC
jgi:transposase-like protein